MHRWARILFVAVTGLTGAACTPEQIGQVLSVIQPAQVTGQGSVTGKVVDQTTQQAVPAARVTVGTQRTTADATGVYGVHGLAAGTLFIHVEAAGYQPFFGEVQIGTGMTRFDIPLKPLAASPAPSGSADPAGSAAVAVPSPAPSPSLPSAPLPSPSLPVGSPAMPSDGVASPIPSPSVQASAPASL